MREISEHYSSAADSGLASVSRKLRLIFVNWIRLESPGSLCQNAAVLDHLRHEHGTLLEIGCGAGSLLSVLCDRGFRCVGVDPTAKAIRLAEENLAVHLNSGRCRLLEATLEQLDAKMTEFDVGLSMMTLEHIERDDVFLRQLRDRVRPGGLVLVGVPARRDCWDYEDEVVGHLRRYERDGLIALLRAADLDQIAAWSVSVPVANLLRRIGMLLVRRATDESIERSSDAAQTATSGIREIPFKTVFPSWFRLLLNPRTLAPLFWLQRFFYRGDRGLVLLASGRVPARPTDRQSLGASA